MNYFLAKTDPGTYSIDDFEKEGETVWDGIHNNAAILVVKAMKPGDQVFIYHSQSDKAILGLAEVTGEPFENKDDPRRSWAVKMKFLKRTKPVSLADFKAEPKFADFILIRQGRLSTMPVPDDIASWINEHI